MNLKNNANFYKTDQSIAQGKPVIVWREVFTPEQYFVADYQRYQGGGHWAGGVFWKHAAPISEVVEIVGGVPAPVPVTPDNSFYGEVWVKAYATSGDAAVADAALSDYKTREANGDFKK